MRWQGAGDMATAETTYVHKREGVLYVGETRVTVSSLISAWRNEGYTAEEAQAAFPALSLAQVYGTIAYYLDHQAELDAQFLADDQEYLRQRERDRTADPEFYARLDERRAQLCERSGLGNIRWIG
jgi:uncharacterized protein (DUF433 family)